LVSVRLYAETGLPKAFAAARDPSDNWRGVTAAKTVLGISTPADIAGSSHIEPAAIAISVKQTHAFHSVL